MDYTKNLQKVFDKKLAITSHQALSNAMQILKKDYLNQIKYHLNWAESIKEDLIDPLVAFYENQTEQGKLINSEVRKAEKDFADWYSKLDLAKSNFFKSAKSAENMKLQSELFKLNNIDNYSSRLNDINKHEANCQRQLKDAKELEKNYIIMLNSVNQVREGYIDVMTKGLSKFQSLEEEYISFVKDCLRKFVVYQVALNRNLQYDIEKKASAMENIDVKSEIISFVEMYKTSNMPPSQIAFEPYSSEITIDDDAYSKDHSSFNSNNINSNGSITKLNKALIVPSLLGSDEILSKDSDDVNRIVVKSQKLTLSVSSSSANFNKNNEKKEIENKDKLEEENFSSSKIESLVEIQPQTNQINEFNKESEKGINQVTVTEDSNSEVKEKDIKTSPKSYNFNTNNEVNTKESRLKSTQKSVREFIGSVFFTKLPEFSVDPNSPSSKQLTEIQTLVDYAFEGKELSIEEKQIFVQNTKKKHNRKFFIECLNKIRSDCCFSFSKKSFETIGFLMYSVLTDSYKEEEYDIINKIITLSQTFYRVDEEHNKPRVFMHSVIDCHSIFKQEKLWRELIKFAIRGELQYQRAFTVHGYNSSNNNNSNNNDDKISNIVKIAFMQLNTFIYHMLNYFLNKNSIKNIILDFSDYYGFSEVQVTELNKIIKEYNNFEDVSMTVESINKNIKPIEQENVS